MKMLDRVSEKSGSNRFSRRTLLRAAGGTIVGIALSACGANKTSTTSSNSQPTTGAMPTSVGLPASTRAGSPSTQSAVSGVSIPTASGTIHIPASGAKLPTQKVDFQVMVQGPGPRTPYYKTFLDAYQKAHPNVNVKFQQLTGDDLKQSLPLSIRNNTAPDIFQLPGGISGAQAVQAGWVAPIDDVIPNFEDIKKVYPPGVFVEGFTVFNGKTYTFPLATLQRYATLIVFNTDYMRKAGYDPASKPLTWDEFRAAAKKLTQQGKGKYYGLIIGGKEGGQFGSFVSNLAQMAGAIGGNMNWKTGQYNFTTDEFRAATELLLGLKADHSLFPGGSTISQREADGRFVSGVAGMTMDGPWVIARWQDSNPDFKYGIGSQPVPSSGDPLPLTYEPGGANHHFLYAKSKRKDVAGDVFYDMASIEGQKAFQALSSGTLRSVIPEVSKEAKFDKHSKNAIKLFDQQLRLSPDPRVRNPDASQVYMELRSIHPDLGETVGGLLSGQVKDIAKAMKDLQDRSEAELERAIKAARKKGAKVSRDDWKFPNWDPTKDYTEEDYKALKN